jgi:hypothetical protein
VSRTLSIEIDASPSQVWDDIQNVTSHVEWMQDAESVVFTSDEQAGVGATLLSVTTVGPIRVKDPMVIVAWEPEREMTMRHAEQSPVQVLSF